MATTRYCARIVRGQEEHQSRHLYWKQPPLQTLPFHRLRLVLGRQDSVNLALRRNRARHDAVDADPPLAKFARVRPCHAHDGRLHGRVDGQARRRQSPRDGAHVDDASAAVLPHRRHDGLCEEELVAQVHVDVGLERLGCHLCCGHACLGAGGADVVYEDVHPSELFKSLGGAGSELVKVGGVAAHEDGRRCAFNGLDVVADSLGRRLGNVQEDDIGALPAKELDRRGANAFGAARDKNGLAPQAGVDCRLLHVHCHLALKHNRTDRCSSVIPTVKQLGVRCGSYTE